MVNKTLLREWVSVLRSGEYTQGTGALRKGDSFCCLGVLCDLNNSGTTWEIFGNDSNFPQEFDGEEALLPEWLADRAGVSVNPCVPVDLVNNYKPAEELGWTNGYSSGTEIALAELNDYHVPFDMIADIIWEHYDLGSDE